MGILRKALLLALAMPAAARAGEAAAVDFVKEVQPILKAHCYECHGPEDQNGGFRADVKQTAFGATDSGRKPIVAGDVAKSDIIRRVRSSNEDEMMPPDGERLSAKQIALLTRWIEQGANWPDNAAVTATSKPAHWAFKKPIKPSTPEVK